MLDRIIASRSAEVFTPKRLAEIMTGLVSEYSKKEGAGDISVLLNKKDMEELEKGFMSDLQAAVKKGVTLKASDSVHSGFSVSYDGGESRFDFTDEALAEYLGGHLKAGLAELLKAGTSQKDGRKK